LLEAAEAVMEEQIFTLLLIIEGAPEKGITIYNDTAKKIARKLKF
jgi:hypothetical protein